MKPLTVDDTITQRRGPTQWATDAAVILLLFGSMLSAWAITIVAAAALLGLLAYVVLTRDPARHSVAIRALVALAVGGTIAAALLLFR